MSKKILVLNGPNLNLLGKREPHIYGSKTLSDIEQECIEAGKDLDLKVDCKQSNSEGTLIDLIHDARENVDAIIINPGAYSHTSIAIRDALAGAELPIFEIHISNIHKREEFRHFSFISGIAEGVICGCGTKGYQLALQAAANFLSE